MAVGTEPAKPQSPAAQLTCRQHRAIDPIAVEWDQLVPHDMPHLRAGFLRAIQPSGMLEDPLYLMVYHQGQLAAVAVAYTLTFDAAPDASPRQRGWIEWVRKAFPGFMRRSLRVCGSPIENADCGICFAPQLSPDVRRAVIRCVADEVVRSSRHDQTLYFKDFTPEAVADYAGELENLGFFPVDPGPAMQLVVKWPAFEDYLGAMRKRYRASIRKSLKASEGLEFCLLDTFADLAPVAMPLYLNVVARAHNPLQKVTEKFLRDLSEFDQAKLLVARRPETGEVLGINLLLFGDTCMHNTYIGYDDAVNEQFQIYFGLAEHSLRLAMERHCQICYLGQASYEFKVRLGATPVRLTAYMKHRLWPVHHWLRSSREKFFPTVEIPTHDVFHAEGGPD